MKWKQHFVIVAILLLMAVTVPGLLGQEDEVKVVITGTLCEGVVVSKGLTFKLDLEKQPELVPVAKG